MHDVLRPLELMLLCLAGVLTERDRLINLYLREENRILREQLSKRPRLNDDQRRRLAVLGKRLGRQLLGEWASLVTPSTPAITSSICMRSNVAWRWDVNPMGDINTKNTQNRFLMDIMLILPYLLILILDSLGSNPNSQAFVHPTFPI